MFRVANVAIEILCKPELPLRRSILFASCEVYDLKECKILESSSFAARVNRK